MNSYPPELLVQLAPVMFATGLDIPPPTDTPQSPSPKDPFIILISRLRDALLSQKKVSIWQPEKSKTFQVVLVDKDVRFPPRKTAPPQEQPYAPVHSPLSPLTPSSPLHPDGLIAPIWIRKHTALVPSVFVVFTRLFESPQTALKSPLDHVDADRERERESEERKRDAELAADVAQRKRNTGERGIKLTVVLMASRRMLDDPSLDARLTYIRRQSGLDPRAALFVLSPVSQAEIGDFVRSLQEALYEPAVEYYTAHSKRVRRKRNRHSQASVSYPLPVSPLGVSAGPRPLRPEGWTVRYEYKMACFAEFRGEDEVALKHYQDAYATLHVMFGSTAILPPRTKRWAEAKVLADSISVKICKLYLYNNEHALALAHHNMHMRRFSDLSRGWGIGEETFEFWSWLARQQRVFAELLEQGMRSTLQIPKHMPVVPPAALPVENIPRGVMEVDAMRVLGLNPSQALQHPGFYYYMAARCTENRRARFLGAVGAEANIRGGTSTPGFMNETKVDHLTIVLELYTRAYELFKKHSPESSRQPGQSRLTLWIAYRIAQTYHEAGKFDMAVRFFERIAKTYRREGWGSMLRPLLSTWYACAQQLGDVELSVRLLVEMIGYGAVSEQEDPDALQEDLLAVLNSTVPSSTDQALVMDLSDSEPILDSSCVFWVPEITVDETAAFQLRLTAPSGVSLSALPFTTLSIHFDYDIPPIIVQHMHAGVGEMLPAVQKVEIGTISIPGELEPRKEVEANLRWNAGSSIVFSGSVIATAPAVLSMNKLCLTLKQGSWWIEIPLMPTTSRFGHISTPKWLSSLDPVRYTPIRRDICDSLTIHYRPHRVQVALTHDGPAYIGEEFPITVNVTNTDDRELMITVDVLLHPTEIDDVVNYITFDEQRSTSLIKGVVFGVISPGVSVVKTLYLGCCGGAGDRILDVSVQSRATSGSIPKSPTSPSEGGVNTTEVLHTLIVTAAEAIKVEYEVVYKRSLKERPGPGDLKRFDDGYWDDATGGEAVVTTTLSCTGPSGIKVEGLKLNKNDSRNAKVTDCSLDEDTEEFLTEWLTGDEFCDRCRVSLSLNEEHPPQNSVPGPGEYEVVWRRLLPDGGYGSISTSRFPLPILEPPSDGLVALLDIPPTAKLHVPITLRIIVRNQHPTRAANVVVQLETDVNDGFVVAGLRSGQLPVLLPEGEEQVYYTLIPIECGFIPAPRIKVTNKRNAISTTQGHTGLDLESGAEGEIVDVVDIHGDKRLYEDQSLAEQIRASLDSTVAEGARNAIPPVHREDIVVLVLP